MTIYRARMHPWGKALNCHTYLPVHTSHTLSCLCGTDLLGHSTLECRTFGALVLKPQRNKPHKDPVLGRTCCYGEKYANMSWASCLFFSCQQENTKSNPNVSVSCLSRPSWLFSVGSTPCLTKSSCYLLPFQGNSRKVVGISIYAFTVETLPLYASSFGLNLWQFSCLSFLRVEISGVRHYV